MLIGNYYVHHFSFKLLNVMFTSILVGCCSNPQFLVYNNVLSKSLPLSQPMKFFDTPSTVKLTIKIMARFCIENDKLIFSQ